nr:TPA_asm: m44.5 ORF [Murid betaherpesvirus 1]DBA07771.1 TPA_asm: m44.5 ORF [Murid betaherpesvirus 1]
MTRQFHRRPPEADGDGQRLRMVDERLSVDAHLDDRVGRHGPAGLGARHLVLVVRVVVEGRRAAAAHGDRRGLFRDLPEAAVEHGQLDGPVLAETGEILLVQAMGLDLDGAHALIEHLILRRGHHERRLLEKDVVAARPEARSGARQVGGFVGRAAGDEGGVPDAVFHHVFT